MLTAARRGARPPTARHIDRRPKPWFDEPRPTPLCDGCGPVAVPQDHPARYVGRRNPSPDREPVIEPEPRRQARPRRHAACVEPTTRPRPAHPTAPAAPGADPPAEPRRPRPTHTGHAATPAAPASTGSTRNAPWPTTDAPDPPDHAATTPTRTAEARAARAGPPAGPAGRIAAGGAVSGRAGRPRGHVCRPRRVHRRGSRPQGTQGALPPVEGAAGRGVFGRVGVLVGGGSGRDFRPVVRAGLVSAGPGGRERLAVCGGGNRV
jgi:hypothetical protein